VACLPVRKDDDARTKATENTHDSDAILKGVGECAVREIERLTPADSENTGGFVRLAGAIGCGAARAGFALGQIENCRAQTARSHAQEGSSAGLFHVVAMGGDGEDVSSEFECLSVHRSQKLLIV
jgi:hypothetical protein